MERGNEVGAVYMGRILGAGGKKMDQVGRLRLEKCKLLSKF